MTPKPFQSEQVSYQKASLLTRLDDALALFNEPIWHELKYALIQPKQKETPKEWYKANPERLVREKTMLSKVLSALPECPNIFFRQEQTDRLGALGLVEMPNREKARVELIFPENYPDSPPQVSFFRSLQSPSRQTSSEGRRISVPMDLMQQWNSNLHCDVALNWAKSWLVKTFDFVRPNQRKPRS